MKVTDGAWILPVLLLRVLTSCVEEYVPDEDRLRTGTLVVIAHLDDQPGYQEVQVSTSSTLITPVFEPKEGCVVVVEREDGTMRTLLENKPGYYGAQLDRSFLVSGRLFRIRLYTPSEEEYLSDFEKLWPAPPIDSVYYELEEMPTADPDHPLQGIRFYIDFEMDPDSGRYLRWGMTETYELHTPNHLGYIYDVDRRIKPLPDSLSWRTCWITDEVSTIFTLSLEDLAGDTYRRMPLNFVSNEPQRLYYGYSLLIHQYSLSESAYRYWNELRKNAQDAGGLFSKQPSLTPGNIYSTGDPSEPVIGYFSISGVSERRVFVKDVPGLELPDYLFCYPSPEPLAGLYFLKRSDLPLYIATAELDGVTYQGMISKHCLDCREFKGSTNMVPDFWGKNE